MVESVPRIATRRRGERRQKSTTCLAYWLHACRNAELGGAFTLASL